MKNLLCIFFGHKDDEITFQEKDYIRFSHHNIPLGYIKMCERCNELFIETLAKKNIKDELQ